MKLARQLERVNKVIFLFSCISASDWTVGFSVESAPELSSLSQVEFKTESCTDVILYYNNKTRKDIIDTSIINTEILCLYFSNNMYIYLYVLISF